MGIFDNIVGLEGLNLNFSGILSVLGKFLGLVILFGFTLGILFFLLWRKNKKKKFNQFLHFFERSAGNPLAPTDDYKACIMTIPKTTLRVLYVKDLDLYLPMPTRSMKKNHYWYAVRDNKELINFRLKDLNKELSEAHLDYDHSDMRPQEAYLKELIQRNYRDKATKWWQEYKELIATVILIFVLGITFFFLYAKLGTLVDKIGTLVDHADMLVKSAEATRGSGVIQV